MLTINVALLLAIIFFVRLRRHVQARSRADQMMTALIVLAFGVLVAPTAFGQGLLDFLSQLAHSISQAGT